MKQKLSHQEIPHISVLGVKINILSSYSEAINIIQAKLATKQGGCICVTAVHLLMETQFDPRLLDFVNSSLLSTADGMPLVWISKLRGHSRAHRIYGPTLMKELCKTAAENNWPIFFLGGAPGESHDVATQLAATNSHLTIAGYSDTPQKNLTKSFSALVLKKITTTKTKIVFVGMGCPYQENWIKDYHHLAPQTIFIGVGAAFDFISGRKKQAPMVVQNFGFEWLFRLIQEPRRLAYRYLVLNLYFIYLLVRSLVTKFLWSYQLTTTPH